MVSTDDHKWSSATILSKLKKAFARFGILVPAPAFPDEVSAMAANEPIVVPMALSIFANRTRGAATVQCRLDESQYPHEAEVDDDHQRNADVFAEPPYLRHKGRNDESTNRCQ